MHHGRVAFVEESSYLPYFILLLQYMLRVFFYYKKLKEDINLMK